MILTGKIVNTYRYWIANIDLAPATSARVFALDVVASDGGATVILWFVPLDLNEVLVTVLDFWFARFARLVWNEKKKKECSFEVSEIFAIKGKN